MEGLPADRYISRNIKQEWMLHVCHLRAMSNNRIDKYNIIVKADYINIVIREGLAYNRMSGFSIR